MKTRMRGRIWRAQLARPLLLKVQFRAAPPGNLVGNPASVSTCRGEADCRAGRGGTGRGGAGRGGAGIAFPYNSVIWTLLPMSSSKADSNPADSISVPPRSMGNRETGRGHCTWTPTGMARERCAELQNHKISIHWPTSVASPKLSVQFLKAESYLLS